MFSNSVISYLEEMGFNSDEFYERISQLFPSKEHLFNDLILSFYHKKDLFNEDFNSFSQHNNIEDETLNNTLLEVYNNIIQFQRGGKFEVFKYREAAWGLPSNLLNREDIIDTGDLLDLCDNSEIYRGMSNDEFIRGNFGQSWTTVYEEARRFAENTYSDKPKGIVVKTTISKIEVLHYDKNKEFEVIVIKGSPKKSNVSICS